MGLFDCDTPTKLAEWVQNTPAGQDGVKLQPADAKKLANKIKRKKITGKLLQGKDLNGIQTLLGQSWNPAIVQELARVVADKKEEERKGVHGGPGAGPVLPDTFMVNIGGIGTTNKTMQVEKSWTLKTFKEKLYPRELGVLPEDGPERERKLKDFNLAGYSEADHDVK